MFWFADLILQIVSSGGRKISVYQQLQKSASDSDSIKVKDTEKSSDWVFPGPAVGVKIHRRCSSDVLQQNYLQLYASHQLQLVNSNQMFLFPSLISPFSSAPSVDCAVTRRRRRDSVANGAINRHKPRRTRLSMQTSHLAKHLRGQNTVRIKKQRCSFYLAAPEPNKRSFPGAASRCGT